MAITIQEAQVLFSADGMNSVQTQAGRAAQSMLGMTGSATRAGAALAGIGQSAGSIGTIGSQLSFVTDIIENTSLSFEELENEIIQYLRAQNQIPANATRASAALTALNSVTTTVKKSYTALKSAMSGVGGTLAALGATAGITKLLTLSAEAETTAISFEVLLGSVSKAKQALDDLKALDKKTVFGLQELSAAQKLMLNFGLNADESFTVLSQLTEVAQGNSEQLMLLARAMAQVKAAGRLMGQEANQLINSGFSPLYEISQQTGRSMADLKKDMEAGLVSYDMVRQALEGLTTGSGRLAGMNDRLSNTTAGMFGKFQTNIGLLATQIGSALLPELNKMLEFINGTAESLNGVRTTSVSMVTQAKAVFVELQDNLADLAIAITVAFQALPNQLQLMFTDIKTWLGELVDYAMNAGKSIANNLSPSVLAGQAETMPMPELTFSPRQSGDFFFGDVIGPELEIARRLRAEERQRAGAAEAAAAMRAGQRPDRGQAPPTTELGDAIATAISETQMVQRGGAADMFRSLQDRLAKQFETDKIAKQQLDVQKQQLDVNKQILGAFSGGLSAVAILGT